MIALISTLLAICVALAVVCVLSRRDLKKTKERLQQTKNNLDLKVIECSTQKQRNERDHPLAVEARIASLCLLFGQDVSIPIQRSKYAGDVTHFKNCILFDTPAAFHPDKPSISGIWYDPRHNTSSLLNEPDKSKLEYARNPTLFGLRAVIAPDQCPPLDGTDLLSRFGNLDYICAAVEGTIKKKIKQ